MRKKEWHFYFILKTALFNQNGYNQFIEIFIKEVVKISKEYEELRDKFIRDGMGEKEAKKKAVIIHNESHPSNPVTRKHEDFQDIIGGEDVRPAKIL